MKSFVKQAPPPKNKSSLINRSEREKVLYPDEYPTNLANVPPQFRKYHTEQTLKINKEFG